MKLEHEYTVPAPVDEAWKVLLDVERIAPCMPGATLLSHDADSFTGTVKVKVGPVSMLYKGEATFASVDEATHRAVIEASGKESRGSGTASATVTATLHAASDTTTRVAVDTDLNVTGKPAQFGRGVLAEVGSKLIGQFATCLAEELGGAPEAVATSGHALPAPEVTAPVAQPQPLAAAPAVADGAPAEPSPLAARRSAEAIDLLDVAGGSVAKRVLPLGAALLLLLLLRLIRRRSADVG